VRRYTLFGSFSNFNAISCRFVCLSLSLSRNRRAWEEPSYIKLLPQFCRNRIRHRSEREEGGGGERDGGWFVRTERSLAGFELERTRWELCWMASQGGKRMDGWMDGFRSECTWHGSFFLFLFLFLFGFQENWRVKKRGKYVNASYKMWCNQRFPFFFSRDKKIGIYFLECKFNSFCYFVGNFLRTFQYHKIEGKKTLNINLAKFY